MTELARAKRVYSAYLAVEEDGVAGEADTQHFPVNLWVPPGDIRIIGADLWVMINQLADADYAKANCYAYGSLAMLPIIGGANELVSGFAIQGVVELPTVGEHALNGQRISYT